MRWRSHLGVCGLVAAAVAVALAADWWRAQNRPSDSAELPAEMDVPARIGMTTQVGFLHDGPPPWPRGNCFSLALEPGRPDGPALGVVNIHTENFGRAVRDLGLETVRVRRIGHGQCLVIDPRIPRNWLRDEPCRTCVPPDVRRELMTAYPEWFRPRDAAEAGAGRVGGDK